jgi:PAP2 superfamily
VEEAAQPQVRPRLRFPGLLPRRMRAIRRPRLWEEVLFIGGSYLLYSLIRNGVPTHERLAFHRASQLLTAEHWVRLDFELTLNKALAGVNWLAQVADYYYATMHFAVTIGVLAWLYLRHPLHYRPVRTALYATNIIALVGFWLFPLAPPRMLHGYVDTVVQFNTWGSWGSSGVDAASNQFAAMPSLHIGWSLWCACAIVMLAKRNWVKVLGALYPVVTCLVIMATANHYILDAAGGVVALMLGFGVQRLLYGRPAFADPELDLVATRT